MAVLCRLSAALALGLACLIGTNAAALAEAADDFYKGRQIRLVVSTDAGGAYDTYARVMARRMLRLTGQ